jgi:hypothetical protein
MWADWFLSATKFPYLAARVTLNRENQWNPCHPRSNLLPACSGDYLDLIGRTY